MKGMGWSWEELENTPETVYQSVLRILSLEGKEKIRSQKIDRKRTII